MTPYIRLHPRDGVKVYSTGPCTGSLLHCHIGLQGLELYTHTASGRKGATTSIQLYILYTYIYDVYLPIILCYIIYITCI